MYAPIFDVCESDPAVTALLGISPMRLYLFGVAPKNVAKPYAVWQLVAGGPLNRLSGRADIDSQRLQVDAYAETASAARQVVEAIRSAIELHCNISSFNGDSQDPETLNYRSSFDVAWLVER
ncbi:DUF3168 domain-containing protein [Pseudomonas syringae group genomosp. 3]|uniref:DUF3168 domain-containing protein n=1 Tax=Pseudomonas syringae pv. persicae TaxID=237306 RepID=A0AB38E9W3_9PSED|nr:DUF3168 domain-containing protein [Pseudomonas syringae group genomosp. 3]SOQ06549.1 hypothetical protein NCPPB2254_00886 [Pseudomonas syringae pv. persicae]SOQ06830.1 hypothetical protein CFBP1573P_01129 [Pseudomonas syringae pv. persicae]